MDMRQKSVIFHYLILYILKYGTFCFFTKPLIFQGIKNTGTNLLKHLSTSGVRPAWALKQLLIPNSTNRLLTGNILVEVIQQQGRIKYGPFYFWCNYTSVCEKSILYVLIHIQYTVLLGCVAILICTMTFTRNLLVVTVQF